MQFLLKNMGYCLKIWQKFFAGLRRHSGVLTTTVEKERLMEKTWIDLFEDYVAWTNE